jgi:hypothetical protein
VSRYATLIVGVLLGAVLGFGAGRVTAPDHKTAVTTTTQAPTTTTIVKPSLEITPQGGPIGTTFNFVVHGFRPGTGVIFEVDFPDGHIFKGQSHPVAADGSASTTYKATRGNALGTYTVHASDEQGFTAQAVFVVGNAATTTTTA